VGYLGWGTLADQAITTTGGATGVVADVDAIMDTGLGLGGNGLTNTYSSVSPNPPIYTGFILLETGVQSFLLQETGSAPNRIALE
jgi:hypothetical protein